MSTVTQIVGIAHALTPEAQAALLDYAKLLAGDPEPAQETEPLAADGTPAPASLPAGGWYESRYITKKNGRKYGPYRYYCWNQGKTRRAKYIGKA